MNVMFLKIFHAHKYLVKFQINILIISGDANGFHGDKKQAAVGTGLSRARNARWGMLLHVNEAGIYGGRNKIGVQCTCISCGHCNIYVANVGFMLHDSLGIIVYII